MAHIKKGLIAGRPAYNSGGLSLTIGSTVSGGTRGAVTGRSGKIISNNFYFINTDGYYGFDGNELLQFVFTEPKFTKFNMSIIYDAYNGINVFLINTDESSVTGDILDNLTNFDNFEELNFTGIFGNEDEPDTDYIPKFICFEQNGNVNNNIIKELSERIVEFGRILQNLISILGNIIVADNPALQQILEILKPYLPEYYFFILKNLIANNIFLFGGGDNTLAILLVNSIVFKKYGENGSKLTVYNTNNNDVDITKMLISKFKKINKINETTINITDLQSEQTTYTIVKTKFTLDNRETYLSNNTNWDGIENSSNSDFAMFTSIYVNNDSYLQHLTIYNINNASSSVWSNGSKKMYVNLFYKVNDDHPFIPEIGNVSDNISFNDFVNNNDGTYSCLFEIDDTSRKLIKSTKTKDQLIDELTAPESNIRIGFYEFVIMSGTDLTETDNPNIRTAVTNYSGTAYILTNIDSVAKTAEVTTIKDATTTEHNMVIFDPDPDPVNLVARTIKPKPSTKLSNLHMPSGTGLYTHFFKLLKNYNSQISKHQYNVFSNETQRQIIRQPILSKEEIRKNKIREKISSEIEKRRLQSTKNKEIRIKESKRRIKDEKEKRNQSKIRTDEQLDKLIERRIEKMIKDGSIEKLINKGKTKIY